MQRSNMVVKIHIFKWIMLTLIMNTLIQQMNSTYVHFQIRSCGVGGCTSLSLSNVCFDSFIQYLHLRFIIMKVLVRLMNCSWLLNVWLFNFSWLTLFLSGYPCHDKLRLYQSEWLLLQEIQLDFFCMHCPNHLMLQANVWHSFSVSSQPSDCKKHVFM